MIPTGQKADNAPFLFALSTVCLCLVGIVFIYSASSVFALQRFCSPFYYLKRHMIGMCIGVTAFIGIQFVSLKIIKQYAPFTFIGSLLLTLGTLLPGLAVNVHGSSRWLRLGFVTIQPSELLKYSFVLYLAHFFSRKNINKERALTHIYLPFLAILAITSLVLLAQPDFGATVTLCITGMLIAFIAGIDIKHIAVTCLSALPVLFVLILFKPYRLKRVVTFLNPWADPQGAGFQIIQSFIAIGSGNIFGLGIGQSKQKFFYLPMQHTDFIFSIIAEETGFLGAVTIISLFALLLYSGLHLGMKQSDPFCRYTICGFVLLISLQALINIAVTTGLVPTKGIGLPLISYGNSSLVCIMAMLGLLFKIHRK